MIDAESKVEIPTDRTKIEHVRNLLNQSIKTKIESYKDMFTPSSRLNGFSVHSSIIESSNPNIDLPTRIEHTSPKMSPDSLVNIFKPTSYYSSTKWHWQEETFKEAKKNQEKAILQSTKE